MNYREAIEHIKGRLLETVLEKVITGNEEKQERLVNEFDYLSLAYDALDRLEPKEAIPYEVDVEKVKIGNGFWGVGTTIYKCPNCGDYVSNIYKHCKECGQALKYENERV